MKVFWISGLAAIAFVASPVEASGESKAKDHAKPAYGPAMGPDRGVYDMDGPGLATYSDDDGARYEYQGEWTKGQYLDPEQRVYEGQWNGQVIRRGEGQAMSHGATPAGAPYPMPPHAGAPYPAPPYAYGGGYEAYERCLKNEGVSGAAIGAIIGAVAGNRIAGRGNRTGGTLIGAGLGALAGLGVEKAMDRCDKELPQGGYGAAGYGAYPQGYYYYYPQPVITYQMVPITTTTVTEEIYYENVPVKRKSARKWKPKARPKPRCVCR